MRNVDKGFFRELDRGLCDRVYRGGVKKKERKKERMNSKKEIKIYKFILIE